MADLKGQRAIVFVTRTGLQYYSTSLRAVISMGFDQKVVRDLDVADRSTFASQLSAFIVQNKLEPSVVLFVFSEATCFYQDIKESNLAKIEQITEDFVNTVPFETLLTRAYPIKGGSRIVSINEKIYRDIAAAFEAKGFLSVGVLPSFALGPRFERAAALDAMSARAVLVDIDKYKEQSFLARSGSREEESMVVSEEPGKKGVKITRNLVILVVVFVVLIGVFVVLLVQQGR